MPYYAVIFSSRLRPDSPGYAALAERMAARAETQAGFLGMESARDEQGNGLTVSYWRDLDSIRRWKEDPEHRRAQAAGRSDFYESYRVRIAEIDEDWSYP